MAWNRQQPPTPTQSGRPKILIGMPHEARMYGEWAFKMLAPLIYQPVPWCDKVHRMARGIPLPVARDQIAEALLEDKSITHLMWVDSDNVCVNPPDVNAAMKMLYDCNQPIVSGLYRAKQREGFHYAMWMDVHKSNPAQFPEENKGFLPIESFTGNWLQVDTIGMGFVLVQRKVYETTQKPWHPWDTPAPSEDFRWCMACRKAGFQINVFTDVKLRHLGELAVNVDGTFSVLDV